MPPDLFLLMVGRVVEEPDGVSSPVRILLRQQNGQPGAEHQHHLAVGVELREGDVELSRIIDRRDHVHSVC